MEFDERNEIRFSGYFNIANIVALIIMTSYCRVVCFSFYDGVC